MRGAQDLRTIFGASHAEQQKLAPGMLLHEGRHVEDHVVQADVACLFALVGGDLCNLHNLGSTRHTLCLAAAHTMLASKGWGGKKEMVKSRAGHRARIAARDRVQGKSRIASAAESTGLPILRRFSSMATSTCLSRASAIPGAPPSLASPACEPGVSNARLADSPLAMEGMPAPL